MNIHRLLTLASLTVAPTAGYAAAFAPPFQQSKSPKAPATEVKRVRAPQLETNLDLKMPAPIVTKNGQRPADNGHLSLEERRILDEINSRRSMRDPLMSSGVSSKPFDGTAPTISASLSSMQDHLQLDTAPDGTLWAFGGTYKASFDQSGATYIPFLGSQAPQNYPLRFDAPSITVDGVALDVDSRALPRFEHHTAVFDRGPVVERYDIRRGELEQLFVFDRLDTRGELVLSIHVHSELVAGERGDALAFSGPSGGVGYTRAIAVDAIGERINLATTLVDGAIEIRVPAAFVATAAMPLTIDPIVSTIDIPADATRNESSPDISYNATTQQWYIVWEREFSATDDDIWGQMYTAAGAPVPVTGAYVEFTSSQWRLPRVANNRIASQFLVVCQVEGSPVQVWGRTREAGSLTHGTAVNISNNSYDCRAPDVGGDPLLIGPTYYLVVWERYFSIAVDHDIHGQLVTRNGTLQGGRIDIDNSGSSYDKVPSVSNGNGGTPIPTQTWNVTWQRQFTSTDWDIRFAQLTWDGNLAAQSTPLNSSSTDDRWPCSSSNLDPIEATTYPRDWMAVYERRGGDGISDIYATSLRGRSTTDFVNLSELMVAGEGEDQLQPSVDSNGHQFAIAWSERYQASASDFDIYAASFYLAGSDIYQSEGPTNLAFSSDFELHAQVCSRNTAGINSDWFGVVWRDWNIGGTGDSDIEGTVYEVPDHFGNDLGDNYCNAIPNSTGDAAVINASGSKYAGNDPFTLTAFQMPNNVTGYFIGSPNAGDVLPGGSSGRVCINTPLARFNAPGQVLNTGSDGAFSLDVNTDAIPTPTPGVTFPIIVGNTFRFQCWFRDSGTNNLTDGVSVLFR